MKRAKSRNFILIVCGVLIMLLLTIVVFKTVMSIAEQLSRNDSVEDIEKNIISMSSKIKLKGSAVFINSTPILEETTISNYNVRLGKASDLVHYEVSFCNMNNFNIKINSIKLENVSCKNEGNSCDNVKINKYILLNKKLYKFGNLISANSCFDAVLEVEYADGQEDKTELFIGRAILSLDTMEK